ncbi:sialate O-acetylesterase [Paraclostridium tenue]|uniref:Sialate O-acetylesterase n=1 Tax=Paraclostridium tenue TaxID=1737 RepID=A0ABP3XC89_9FIRM
MQNIDVFLLIGQSNARGVGDKTYSEIPNENCFEYLSNNEIIKMRCELEKSEGSGTIAPSFSNRWNEVTKNKVCFIHEAKDGSRIKNWNHDANKFLDDAIIKFNKGVKLINEKYKITNKYVIWIQGESDAKYGSDPIYYKENLKDIANRLKDECNIDKMFVSLTGYWLGHKDYFTRTKKIAAAQFIACKECDILSLGSNRAMTFHDENLTIDDVHYSQIGLNILGRDLSDNILKYNDTKKDIILKDTIDLEKYREYIYKLEKLQNDYI